MFIHSYQCPPFCFTNFTKSPLNSSDQYFESLWEINKSRLKFRNWMLSIKMKFLLISKTVYFSNPFGITLISPSNLLISYIIKWPSWPVKSWKVLGLF